MLENSFFLKGSEKTLVTNGVFKWIRTPAGDGANLEGELQNAIRATMAEAKDAGIENPLVVGAIPFDTEQPSALYVPKSWESFDDPRTALESYAKDLGSGAKLEDSLAIGSTDNFGHEGFTKIVGDAVAEIKDGSLDKVVLSRLRNIKTSRPVPSDALLERLLEQNPSGFTFHVPLPDGKSRLSGTSPELLVRKSGDKFNSQPLAGSAPREAGREKQIVETLLNSPKDRYEHKLVVDSMNSTLSPRSAQLHVPESPECISTSKLFHLATSISGTVASSDENVLSLACLLHPTPALSGFPHQNARKLLQRLEPFDREYFGGIVGYCDSNGDGEWYIAIRCGKLTDDEIQLFAGAGIVSDSVPESEWKETEVKLSTMMHVFNMA